MGFGLVSFQVGVDSLELTRDGKWLIYATMRDGIGLTSADAVVLAHVENGGLA